MYNNVLQNIENIAIWPVISFVIFFLFFICLLWWVFTVDKKFIKYMKELPMGPRYAETKGEQTGPPMGQASHPSGWASPPGQECCSSENKSSSQN